MCEAQQIVRQSIVLVDVDRLLKKMPCLFIIFFIEAIEALKPSHLLIKSMNIGIRYFPYASLFPHCQLNLQGIYDL